MPFCLVPSNSAPLLYCKLISLGGRELRRCQALLLSSKNLAAPTSSSPKSPSQLSLKDPWGPSKVGLDKAGGPSPSGWVFTPCPRCHHHQSPLNHRPGSMGRDKAKRAASIPSAEHRLPNPTDSTKPGVEQGVMSWERSWGFFGAVLMGLRFWGVPREHQSSQRIPTPSQSTRERLEQVWLLIVAFPGVSTSLPGQAPGQSGLSGP